MASNDDAPTVEACPECDETSAIYRRQGRGNAHAGDPDHACLCERCGATFDEPNERPAKNGGPGGRLPEGGKELSAMDPDELFGGDADG